MWAWLAKAGKVVVSLFVKVAKWAYNHPVIALGVGLVTYALTRWVRERTERWGYIPVITEVGAVASYLSTAFQYAIATGTLQRAIMKDVRDRALGWLEKLLDTLKGAGDGVTSWLTQALSPGTVSLAGPRQLLPRM